MADIGTVTARLRADVSQFNSGLQQAQGQVRSLGAAGDHGARGLHTIRSAVQQLANQATGANPIISRLASSVLALGAGQVITLAAVAGLAAIGAAYRLLTMEATHAREQHELMLTALAKTGAIGTARAELMKIQEEIAKLNAMSPYEAALGVVQGKGTRGERLAEAESKRLAVNRELTSEIAKQTAEIKKQLDELHKRLAEAEKARRKELLANLPEPTSMATTGFPWQQTENVPAIMRGGREVGGPNAFWKSSKVESQIAKDMKALGVDAMAAFVAGIATGATNFGDLLKSIFSAFLTAGITKVFHVLFKIGSPSGWAKDMGGYLAEGLALGIESGTARVGGASLRLASAVPSGFVGAARVNINPTLPASRSPFDVARDADWLRALGESARELGYRGFKFK